MVQTTMGKPTSFDRIELLRDVGNVKTAQNVKKVLASRTGARCYLPTTFGCVFSQSDLLTFLASCWR